MLPHHHMKIGFFFHHLSVAAFVCLTSLQFIFLRILFRKGTPSKHLSRYWPLWFLFGGKKKVFYFWTQVMPFPLRLSKLFVVILLQEMNLKSKAVMFISFLCSSLFRIRIVVFVVYCNKSLFYFFLWIGY